MRVQLRPAAKNAGATLIELVATVLLISAAIIGVLQYTLVSKLHVHMSNIKAAVLQELSDAVVANQDIPETDVGGIKVDVSPHLVAYVLEGKINIQKTRKSDGVYEVQGTVNWRAFPYGNSTQVNLSESVTLAIPQ